MNRLKSPVLWSALAALALLFGRVLAGSGLTGQADAIDSALLTVSTLLGVLNNPTDQSNF